MDSIPVISQLKSLVQACCLDLEGAEQTQQNFSRQCPVVSQIRSAVEAACGDCDAASATQMEQLMWLNGVVNGVPVVGHVKAGIHAACGDFDGAEEAFKSSSRMVGVIGGGIAGGLTGGPAGGVIGAIAGGAAMDGTHTAIDSSCAGEFKSNGTIAAIEAACKAKGGQKGGHIFDAVFGVAGDGVTGLVIGAKIKASTPYAKKVVGKIKDPFKGIPDSKLVRCQKKGAAPVYANSSTVNMGMVREALPEIAKANPGKPVHVAAGMHGAPLQHFFTSDMAPGCMETPKVFFDVDFYKNPKTPNATAAKFGAITKGPTPNYVLYDMGNAAHKAAFKGAMKNPNTVCYVQWCYSTHNPALNATPAAMAQASALGTAVAAIADAGQSEEDKASTSSSSSPSRF